MVEPVENSEECPEKSLQCVENSLQFTKNEELSDVPVEKRQRGRPKGSTDKVPRKRTVIREEPVSPVEVELAPTIAPSPPPVEPKKRCVNTSASAAVVAPSGPVRMQTHWPVSVIIPPSQPTSPRTLLRQSGETIYALQTQRESARREYWAQQIAKSLR